MNVSTLMSLANCRQGDKESVRAYAQRIKTLAIQLWPALLQSQDPSNQDIANTLVYQHFQKGLRPNLMEFLNLKDIKNLDQAVIELSRKETFDQTQRERFGGQVNAVISDPSAVDAAVSRLQKQMTELQTTVTAYMAETTQMVREQLAPADQMAMEGGYSGWPACADGVVEYPTAGMPGEMTYEHGHELALSDWKYKPSKTKLLYRSIKLLGHIITFDGNKVDESKVEAITKIAPPTNKTEVRAFLGITAFYRRFVTNYAKIALPLINLLKKERAIFIRRAV